MEVGAIIVFGYDDKKTLKRTNIVILYTFTK